MKEGNQWIFFLLFVGGMGATVNYTSMGIFKGSTTTSPSTWNSTNLNNTVACTPFVIEFTFKTYSIQFGLCPNLTTTWLFDLPESMPVNGLTITINCSPFKRSVTLIVTLNNGQVTLWHFIFKYQSIKRNISTQGNYTFGGNK